MYINAMPVCQKKIGPIGLSLWVLNPYQKFDQPDLAFDPCCRNSTASKTYPKMMRNSMQYAIRTIIDYVKYCEELL